VIDEAIVGHLTKVKGDAYTEREGNEFLSKFFQVTIRIPPFIADNLNDFVKKLIDQRSVTFESDVQNILISGAIKNPRKVNQFLNNVVAMFRLAEYKERDKKLRAGSITDHTAFLTKIIVIRHEWPQFYKLLEKNHHLLDEINTNINDQKALLSLFPEKSDERKELIQEGLLEFLNGTQYCVVDDIKPFLQLNQAAFEAQLPEIDQFQIAVNRKNINFVLKTFQEADEITRERYIKKINSINDTNYAEGASSTLMNSVYVTMKILTEVKEPQLKEIGLTNLGKHLCSLDIISKLSEFDLDLLFELTTNMKSYFSSQIYEKLSESIIGEDKKINEELIQYFLKNAHNVPEEIMEKVDISLAADDAVAFKLIEGIPELEDWANNNIPKPSKMVQALVDSITLDDSVVDNGKIEIFNKIETHLHSTEKELFIKNLSRIVNSSADATQPIPAKFFEVIENQKILESENVNSLTDLFRALIMSSEKNPDMEQRKQILELVIQLTDAITGENNE